MENQANCFGFLFFLLITANFCVAQNCSWTSSDGTFFHFGGARRDDVDYTFSIRTSIQNVATYTLNFCRNTIKTCQTSGVATATPVCQFNSLSSQSFSLGNILTTTFSDLQSNRQDGYIINYANGSICSPTRQPRISAIQMLCNYDVSTTIVNVEEGILCSYEIAVQSPFGCPQNCPKGKRGGSCSTCLRGFYGPNCVQCPYCSFGACSDGNQGTGQCICQPNWTGPDCNQCSNCTFYAGSNYLFNLTSLAQPDFDYNFQLSSGTVIYANLLAAVNEPCGNLTTILCSKSANSKPLSYGMPNTQIINLMYPFDKGIVISYSNGSSCNANTQYSVVYNINCVRGAPTQIVSVSNPSSCQYLVTINSDIGCPGCVSGYYGPQCLPCKCSNGICNDGYYGDGTCQCNTGWVGALCTECAANYYGKNCTPCACNLEHSYCYSGINSDGSCSCFEGYEGALCDNKVIKYNIWVSGILGTIFGILLGIGLVTCICAIRMGKMLGYKKLGEKSML